MPMAEPQSRSVLSRPPENEGSSVHRALTPEAADAFASGFASLSAGRDQEALQHLERAAASAPDHARIRSYLGLAIARVEGDFARAKSLCESAAKQEFFCPEHYLNMAKVFLLFEQRAEAMRFLRRGLMIDPGQEEIQAAMQSLGHRKLPVLPFLPRRHPINRRLGAVRSLLRATWQRRAAA